mgnify:CR=1 FL=1
MSATASATADAFCVCTQAHERLNLASELPILEVTDDVADLADKLVDSGIVPNKVASDALHIAVASVHAVEYLVTWNFRHIANPFLRDRIRKLVTEGGFGMPTMCSPEELLEYDEND